MKKYFLLFVFHLIFCCPIFGNCTAITATIDTVALSQTKANTLDSLHYLLTKNLSTDEEKVFIIFKWITENISYDAKGFLNPRLYQVVQRQIRVKTKEAYEEKFTKLLANKIFKDKKAVCEGYARLFTYLCELSNIKAYTVTGFARVINERPRKLKQPNHAWNMVEINKELFLLDATWAAGYITGAPYTFVKKYNGFYYKTPPTQFINTHYAQQDSFNLIPQPISLDSFVENAITTEHFYLLGATNFSPKSTLKKDINNMVNFDINIENADSTLVVVEQNGTPNKKETILYLPWQKDLEFLGSHFTYMQGKVSVQFKIQNASTKTLAIFYKNNLIMQYWLQ